MKSSWRRISEEEYNERRTQALVRFPPTRVSVNLADAPYDIYKVSTPGKVVDSGGRVYVVDAGEMIKVLDEQRYPNDVTWLYHVEDLCLSAAGGNAISLKRGTPIAVLPKDWKDQLVARRQDESGGSRH